MKKIINGTSINFDSIKHIDKYGNEFWFARELQKVLDYSDWRNFKKVVDKAFTSIETEGGNKNDWGVEVTTPINSGKGKEEMAQDFMLSRYICYLIVQNGDPKKKVISLGQKYFAIQTRKQELNVVEYDKLDDEDKRFYQRSLTKKGNYELQQLAKSSGVKNMDKFHNWGYKGLYNGETADAIFKRKQLRYREDILDNMVEDELIANMFRISQTKQALSNSNIKAEKEANKVHYKIGKIVRNAIKLAGGKMPEELPVPNKSLKELSKEKNRTQKLLINKKMKVIKTETTKKTK